MNTQTLKQTVIRNPRDVLILNADDLGYHPSIDRGIIQLLQQTHISSVSVMVNGPNIQQAKEAIRQFQTDSQQRYLSCSLGLHFNLTEGTPFSNKVAGSSLAPNGLFLGKTAFYEMASEIEGCLAE